MFEPMLNFESMTHYLKDNEVIFNDLFSKNDKRNSRYFETQLECVEIIQKISNYSKYLLALIQFASSEGCCELTIKKDQEVDKELREFSQTVFNNKVIFQIIKNIFSDFINISVYIKKTELIFEWKKNNLKYKLL